MCDYKPLRHVRFAAVIRNIQVRATSNVYQFEDGTGTITGTMFTSQSGGGGGQGGGFGDYEGEDNDDGESAAAKALRIEFKENSYVSVFARLVWKESRHQLTIVDLRPIEDLNELAYLQLNSLRSHAANTGALAAAGAGAGAGKAGGDGDSLFVGGYTAPKLPSLKGIDPAVVTQVIEYMKRVGQQDDAGIHVQQVSAQVGIDVNVAKTIMMSLVDDGLLYIVDGDGNQFSVIDA